MTQNKETIDRYMDGFRRSDHKLILSCLTDDVEWEIPGAFHARGKEAFDKHIELRVGEARVFYDVTPEIVEVVAIVTKAEAARWLAAHGTPSAPSGTG